jgi:surface antigen
MKLRLPGLAIAIALLVGPGGAAAAGFGFLADSPIARFNADDLKLMNGAIDRALVAGEVGVRTSWVNEKTGSSGEVTPQRAFERNGRACREVRIVNRHRTLEASGVYTMCREDGQWTLSQ